MTARGDMTEAFARAMAAPRRRPKTLLGGRASVNPDTMLGDRLAVVLAEEGCLTCATLARKVPATKRHRAGRPLHRRTVHGIGRQDERPPLVPLGRNWNESWGPPPDGYLP